MSQIKAEISQHTNLKLIFHKNVQGVYAKSTHFCIIDISVFIEIKYGYEWPYLFKILPKFRICLVFEGLTITYGTLAV